jgi:hypothetical protein
VTGADPLDSFEAMWELAEMLGQAKPPTASRADIARAGLEVISAAQMRAYGAQGRVAGMCVDRVRALFIELLVFSRALTARSV